MKGIITYVDPKAGAQIAEDKMLCATFNEKSFACMGYTTVTASGGTVNFVFDTKNMDDGTAASFYPMRLELSGNGEVILELLTTASYTGGTQLTVKNRRVASTVAAKCKIVKDVTATFTDLDLKQRFDVVTNNPRSALVGASYKGSEVLVIDKGTITAIKITNNGDATLNVSYIFSFIECNGG